MNVIIIEDEKPSARRLKRMLAECDIDVVTMLHSVNESIEWFLNNDHPDLIMLDIQLSDGLSFEIFENVTIKSSIIFTTAYDEYALKAFKLNSIDYLLKPIDQDELENAIKQFKDAFKVNTKDSFDFDSIKNLLSNSVEKNYKKRFTIKVGQHLKIINQEDICCFYSQDKATYIHTKENRDYLMDYTLENLFSELNPELFFRVNRKFIIKLDSIKDIIAYSNSRLEIKLHNYNEEQIIVSREKVKDFKEWIN
ncbi:MAG TPA: response regulator transcription factor [Bacteroidia bacterium]|nr:response regulator transcription factor [Bacteroidia bacterium]